MLKIAVVDDEQVYIDQIQEYIAQYTKEKNREIQTVVSHDGKEPLKDYRSGYDMILQAPSAFWTEIFDYDAGRYQTRC